MFKDDLSISGANQHKQRTVINKKTYSRRANKTLVEFTIGIIGLIGIMLALIANNPSQSEPGSGLSAQPTQNSNMVYQLTDDIADKVASMTEVSPMATKVNLVNILF